MEYSVEIGGLAMFNIIIGVSEYTDLIIESMVNKEKLIMVIDDKEKLSKYAHKTVIKTALDIRNSKLVQITVENKKADKIFISTECDKLNLMLAEALKDFNKVYVFLKEEKYLPLVSDAYTVLCVNSLIKTSIQKELS